MAWGSKLSVASRATLVPNVFIWDERKSLLLEEQQLKTFSTSDLELLGLTKREAFPEQEFSEESQIGFVGQEIEAICPEVVSTDLEGYKYLDYSRLTPVLVEAIKEQQGIIEQQKSALGEALGKLAQLEVIVQKMSSDS